MNAAAIVMLVVRASLALTVLAVALNARAGDAMYLLRHPLLLLRSFVSMSVVMPFVALWFAIVFSLSPPVKLALITLAISPVPPFLPTKEMKSGGDRAYTVSLLTTMSLLSIVVIPLTMVFFGSLFDLPLTIRPATIANIVGNGILLPAAAGLGARRYLPLLADKLARPVDLLAKLMLVTGLVPLLIKAWPAIHSVVDDGTVSAIIGITAIGLGVGHTLGGPSAENRPVLALATACRHPAVAIAVASNMFPSQSLVGAAVVANVLIAAAVTTPYVRMTRRVLQSDARPQREAADHADTRTPSHRRA
jgi:BASS family bile acid:Na+ symporter